MAKSLGAPYQAGRRGAGWLKVKPVHTLDLVVLAVEWGSGRRQGKLSNIHLGALDPASGGYVMVGKTFKGMTDEMLDWQTARFRSWPSAAPTATSCELRPEQVVEIALDGVQRSSRYPGGLALRFARVVRYRDDKRARRRRHHRHRARHVRVKLPRPFSRATRRGAVVAPRSLRPTPNTSATSAPTTTCHLSQSSTAPPSHPPQDRLRRDRRDRRQSPGR